MAVFSKVMIYKPKKWNIRFNVLIDAYECCLYKFVVINSDVLVWNDYSWKNKCVHSVEERFIILWWYEFCTSIKVYDDTMWISKFISDYELWLVWWHNNMKNQLHRIRYFWVG